MNKRDLTARYKAAYRDSVSLMQHYGGTEEHVKERILPLERILTATTPTELDFLAKKALSSIEMYALSLWSKRKIPGPNTPLSIETKAKKAESLARYLDKKAVDKHSTPEEAEKFRANAEKQRERAGVLYKAAEAARAQPKEASCDSQPTSGTTGRAKVSRAGRRSRRS